MKREIIIEELTRYHKFFNDFSVEEMIRLTAVNGNREIVLSEIKEPVRDVLEAFHSIEIRDLESLPTSSLKILNENTRPIADQLLRFRNEEPDKKISEEAQFKKYITFFRYDNPPFEQNIKNINDVIFQARVNKANRNLEESQIVRMEEKLSELVSLAGQQQQQIQDIVNTAQKEIATSGTSIHSEIFSIQAGKHDEKSSTWENYIKWLIGSNVFVITSILVLILFVIDDNTLRIETGILGTGLVSMLSYALVLCVKNYFAEKHNYVINQHRSNCLGTFNTFVDAADSERKGVILIQASNAIFSHLHSGYLTKESDISSPNPLVEVVKNITTKEIIPKK